MTKTILCAVDVSDTGDEAKILKKALQLAALDGAQLDVVTVVPDYGLAVVAGYFSKDHHDKMVAESKLMLSAFVESAIGAEENAKVRHVIATGKAYEEIIQLAEKTNAGTIVIGAHKPDFKDYLLGPNAARVVRHSTCSVFVVR